MDNLTNDTVKIGRLYSKIIWYIMLFISVIIGLIGLITSFSYDDDYYYVNGTYLGNNKVSYTVNNVDYENELKNYGNLDKIYNKGNTIKLFMKNVNEPQIYVNSSMILIIIFVLILIGYIPYILAQKSDFFAVIMSLQLVKGLII